MAVRYAIYWSDSHVPFHDERCFSLAFQVADSLGSRLKEIVIGGDFADFYSVMAHQKDPSIKIDLVHEVQEVNRQLDIFDKYYKKTNRVFIEGNHCFRLERYIAARCPELFGIVDCKTLFKIKERGWKWIDYGPEQKYKVLNSKLYCKHEPLGPDARSTVTKAMASVIFGHTHRVQESQIVSISGENYRGINAGWLGSNHKIFNYVKGHHQWANAFAVIAVLDDGTFFCNVIHIINNKCIFNGKVYRA